MYWDSCDTGNGFPYLLLTLLQMPLLVPPPVTPTASNPQQKAHTMQAKHIVHVHTPYACITARCSRAARPRGRENSPRKLSQSPGFLAVRARQQRDQNRKQRGCNSRRMSGCASMAHFVRPTCAEMWNMKP